MFAARFFVIGKPKKKTGKTCKTIRAGNEFFDILVFTSIVEN
jgi:hypothetical protein